MKPDWFTPTGFVGNTRENTAKTLKIPRERVQDRLHVVVVVVIFPESTSLKIGTLKRASVYTLKRKKTQQSCTYGTDLRGQNVPSYGTFFGNGTGKIQTCLPRSRFCLVTQRSFPTVLQLHLHKI